MRTALFLERTIAIFKKLFATEAQRHRDNQYKESGIIIGLINQVLAKHAKISVISSVSLCLCGITAVASVSYAEPPPASYALGLGLEISSGSFGTTSTSTYATVPLILDWYPTERLDIEVTVPFLYQRTTNTGHAVLGTTAESAAKSAARGNMFGGGAGSGTVSGGGSMMGSSGSGGGSMFAGDYGLGDITVTSGYTLLRDSDTSPHVRPTVYLKFPTASESDGFGTGAYDAGAGVAVSKWLGSWQPFAEARYIVQGIIDDSNGGLNFVTADAGLAYGWNDQVITSLYARFGSALFDGLSAPLEARAKMTWRFSERAYTELYALKGFSDGSPDYGGGISIFREF